MLQLVIVTFIFGVKGECPVNNIAEKMKTLIFLCIISWYNALKSALIEAFWSVYGNYYLSNRVFSFRFTTLRFSNAFERYLSLSLSISNRFGHIQVKRRRYKILSQLLGKVCNDCFVYFCKLFLSCKHHFAKLLYKLYLRQI